MSKNQSNSEPSFFLSEPKLTASKKKYAGRFVCHDIQWTGTEQDLVGTFTITAAELTDAAESNLLWTDQDVQRGIRPEIPDANRELSLSDGYPPKDTYIFDADNADDIVEKLLSGARLFLNPLVWNLRPDSFAAYRDAEDDALYIYDGKIYIPDSHHRQQAIIKATKLWRDSPADYPQFDDSRQFKVEIYFLSKEGEGDYFYDKNQRPTPTSKSKAYDLTTGDALSLLAKQVIDNSVHLKRNVNRVTDRLSSANSQVITLSTLREMMNTFVSGEYLETTQLSGMAKIAAQFYDMLAEVRPELGVQTAFDRREIRRTLLVESAVMMHGYAHLMKMFNSDFAELGSTGAIRSWTKKLSALSAQKIYKSGNWSGDLFDKSSPLWRATGVTKPSRDGISLTVVNTGSTRLECGRVLRQLVTVDPTPSDVGFLITK